METTRAHLVIEGRVQGVWFRESTRRQAELLGLSGWVRNLPDGRVEAVFEGSRSEVESMLTWTEHGPDMAMVTNVEVRFEAPEGTQGFRVR